MDDPVSDEPPPIWAMIVAVMVSAILVMLGWWWLGVGPLNLHPMPAHERARRVGANDGGL
jgi:hypothetical protein